VKIERRWFRPGVDPAIDCERRSRRFDEQLVEKPSTRSASKIASEPLDRQLRFAADPRDALEDQLPPDRVIRERQRRVQRGKMRWQVRGAEVERIAQDDVAIDDLDRLNLDRAARSRAFLLARLAPDERGEIPAAVGLLRRDDPRSRHADASQHDAGLKQLTNAVAERDVVDPDKWAAVARHADVIELETSKERSFEPADGQRRRQVLVRLPYDELADLILGPAGLQNADTDADNNEDDENQADEHASDPARDGA
jgi:hypothetical protein